MNYYKDLWTKPNNHGTIFWRDVDFNKKEYKLQEHVFRQLLISLKNLNRLGVQKREIRSVLEVGAGTGRMTKIVLEEFPSIDYYIAIDIRDKSQFFIDNENKIRYIQQDIVDLFKKRDYKNDNSFDLVLCSEVLMHIKPSDIEAVIKKVTRLLAPKGLIINIDWFFEPNALSEWCFIHDYHKMYEENGLTPLFTADMREIKQKIFCYGV